MTKKGRKMQKRHNFERQSENEDDDQDLQLVAKAADWSFQQHRSPLKGGSVDDLPHRMDDRVKIASRERGATPPIEREFA